MFEDVLPDELPELAAGMGLCLSGGGYRAMVFHLGALIRLDEAGILSRLDRVSSVSGGSVTAVYLGLKWSELDFDREGRAQNLGIVVDGIRSMSRTSVDAGSIIGGILTPSSASDRVAKAYSRTLFGDATLRDLPDDTDGRAPFFVINACNVKTAALWRFTRRYMGDYRVGMVSEPTTPLASAVAASSAFPPWLSPFELEITQDFDPKYGGDLVAPAYRKIAILSDGGVYDNLGLETVAKNCDTVFVSDAGQKIESETHPKDDWARHSLRIMDIVDNQVRSLRKRAIISAYRLGRRAGTYWSIRTRWSDYGLDDDPLGCGARDPSDLAALPTRLEAIPDDVQKRLINWGYAVTDAALRRHVGGSIADRHGVTVAPPAGFPYEGGY